MPRLLTQHVSQGRWQRPPVWSVHLLFWLLSMPSWPPNGALSRQLLRLSLRMSCENSVANRDPGFAALTPCLTKSGTIGASVANCYRTTLLLCRRDSLASCDRASC